MFEKISIHTPRQFIPANLNPGDWASLEPLFDQLEQQLAARPTRPNSSKPS